MKHTIKTIVVASLVVLGAVAMAQGGGGGGGRQGGGGGFGQGRGGGGQTAASLVNIKEVQAEIKLTEEQIKKLADMQTKQREEAQAARQNGGGGGGFGGGGGQDPEAMAARQKAQAERNAKAEAAVKEIISADQWKRVWEIWVQNQGNRAIINEQVQKDLGFTDDQKAKVKDLQTKQREAQMAMGEKMRNGEIERSEIQDIFAKQQKTMEEELGKILTTEQAAKLKEMGGKEFKLPARNGGGGGRGGI